MIKTDSLFLVCVSSDKLLTAIMLPNTKHLAPEAIVNVKNKLNDVIGIHNSKKVTTGHLCRKENGEIGIHVTTPHKPKSIKGDFFTFHRCRKRFQEHDLITEDGDFIPPNKKQTAYLESNLITHAWAALHKGHVVGLITYPYLKSNRLHDKAFFKYQAIARKALQTIGYVVACDLVLDRNNQLKVFNIHNEYERQDKKHKYFTRELPVTKHLKFSPV